MTESRLKDGYSYHVDLELIDGTALVEQTRVISKNRITNPMRKSGRFATITKTDWDKINKELQHKCLLKQLR